MVAVLATWIYSAAVTYVLLRILDVTMGLRVTPEDELIGLDSTQHAETAYNLADSGSVGRLH